MIFNFVFSWLYLQFCQKRQKFQSWGIKQFSLATHAGFYEILKESAEASGQIYVAGAERV
jgi:hypothetical protein